MSAFIAGNARAQKSAVSPSPATVDEMNTYMFMSINTFCQASDLGLDFDKSMSTALAGVSSVFSQKHGFMIKGQDKKLTGKQFVNQTVFNVVGAALQACPKSIPADKKKEFNSMLKEINKNVDKK